MNLVLAVPLALGVTFRTHIQRRWHIIVVNWKAILRYEVLFIIQRILGYKSVELQGLQWIKKVVFRPMLLIERTM